MSYFDRAFNLAEAVEKGYVKDPKDPGGETKYGISKRAYPKLDILNLSLADAKEIYRRDYWGAHGCEQMDWGKALLVFDCAVNGGAAKRWYDMYAGYPTVDFIIAFQAEHTLYLASLPGWHHDGRGWMRRQFRMAIAANREP